MPVSDGIDRRREHPKNELRNGARELVSRKQKKNLGEE